MTEFNEFFSWNLLRPFEEHPAPLTEDEEGELFVLMDDPALHEDAMNAEMADGYLTALVIGPDTPPVHDWLEALFGQPTLPFADAPERQERVLSLWLRRFRQITGRLGTPRGPIDTDHLYLPLQGEVPPEDCITPYQLGESNQRLGEWELKEWAAGFRIALMEDDEGWAPLFDDREAIKLIAPIMIYSEGYNPDYRGLQLEQDLDLPAVLIATLYRIRDWWRAFHQQEMRRARSVRTSPKVGRNELCRCGSGKKYKKCCGA